MRAGVLVLFGSTGDLSKKKLFPALYDLEEMGQLPVPVVGVASSKWDDAQFRKHAEDAIRTKKPNLNEEVLKSLLGKLHLVVGDYNNIATFQDLANHLKQYELPVKIIIINNRYMGMVRQWQELIYNSRESHSYMESLPDFVKLAECFGIIEEM